MLQLIIATVMVLSALGSAAQAEPLKLVTGNDYKPLTDRALPQGGLATALVRAAFSAQGRQVEIDFMPWRRGYHETLKGAYTATFPYVESPERRAKFHYSDPIFHLTASPMVRAGSGLKARTTAELAGSVYCLPIGYATEPAIAAMTDAGELKRQSPLKMEQCVQMLMNEHVDFVVINQLQGLATTKRLFGTTAIIRFLSTQLQRDTLHVIVPRKAPRAREMVKTFNAGLREIRSNGAYDRLVARHMASLVQNRSLTFHCRTSQCN